MLRGMSARQLADWSAYYSVQPRGDERADRHAALICAMVFNAAELIRAGKTNFRFKPEDFLLVFGQHAKVKEGSKKPAAPKPVNAVGSHLKMAARMWASVMNAEMKRESKRKRR